MCCKYTNYHLPILKTIQAKSGGAQQGVGREQTSWQLSTPGALCSSEDFLVKLKIVSISRGQQETSQKAINIKCSLSSTTERQPSQRFCTVVKRVFVRVSGIWALISEPPCHISWCHIMSWPLPIPLLIIRVTYVFEPHHARNYAKFQPNFIMYFSQQNMRQMILSSFYLSGNPDSEKLGISPRSHRS